MKATDMLKKEHDTVKITLEILDKIAADLTSGNKIEIEHLENIIEFLQVFVDKCHHAKEERLLFVAMREAGDDNDREEILLLLGDHQIGRMYIGDMAQDVEKYKAGNHGIAKRIAEEIRDYIVLQQKHIERENDGLLAIAEGRLSDGRQYKLSYEFDQLDSEQLGDETNGRFLTMIRKLRAIYLI